MPVYEQDDSLPIPYQALNTIFQESITAQRKSIIEEQFQYNINTKTLTATEDNSATVTQNDSMAVLTSSTNATGNARLESKKYLRYRAGVEGYAFFTCIWSNGGVANSTQYAGIFDDNDGFFLGYDGVNFVVGRRKSTTDTTVQVESFNGDMNFINEFDNTKLNIFCITYGWLGTAPINFFWCDSTGIWHLIHSMQLPNTLTGPSVNNPFLPMALQVKKTSGSTSIVMKSASWHCGVNNTSPNAGNRYFSAAAAATSITTETVLLNLRNNNYSKVMALFTFLSAAADGTKTGKVKFYKNLAIGGTPSWADVDATNSTIEKDTAGTITPDDANLIWEFPLGRTDSQFSEVLNEDLFLLPGETVSITGQSANNMDFDIAVRWLEEY